jgi:hypothetical protein
MYPEWEEERCVQIVAGNLNGNNPFGIAMHRRKVCTWTLKTVLRVWSGVM